MPGEDRWFAVFLFLALAVGAVVCLVTRLH